MTSVPSSSNELPTNITPPKDIQNKSKTGAPVDLKVNKTHKVAALELNEEATESQLEIHTVKSIPAGTNQTQTDASLSVIKTAFESIQLEKKDIAAQDPQMKADKLSPVSLDPDLPRLAKLAQENQNKSNVETSVAQNPTNQKETDEKSVVSPTKKQNALIERLIPQPAEVRQLILKGLSIEELISLEIALASSHLAVWNKLAVFVKNVRDQIILDNLLLDHPTWVNQISAWKDISVEDKIWLIRLYELYRLNTTIPQIDNLYPKFDSSSDTSSLLKRFTFNISENDKLGFAQYSYRLSQIPTERTPELLKQKNEINEMLNTYPTLCVPLGTQLDSNKLPDAIYLLKNLKRLCIHNRDKLECLPNLKAFKRLEELQIDNTPLSSPPNTSHNEQLKSIVLKGCNLTHAPNVRNNPNLQKLILDDNNLKEAPDISNNPALEGLAIRNNMLTTPPNLKKNPNLKTVNLRNNKLIESPDTSNNEKLEYLYLMNNEITEFPNIQNNKCLKELHLDNNRLNLRIFQ